MSDTPALDAQTLAAALQPGGGRPLHSQLESGLRGLIESGAVATGAVLPGEVDLATHLRVSRHTVRHALGVLTSEGLLRRERGRGTTVVSSAPMLPRVFERSLSAFYAFAWEVRATGAQQQSFILERKALPAEEALATRLNLAPGTPLERIVRLRMADGVPLVLETTHLPHTLSAALEGEALERGSIYDELERLHGLRVTGARESIRPIVLAKPIARLLQDSAGAPALSVERTTLSDRGPIEWQESIIRGDRFLYSVDLPRV